MMQADSFKLKSPGKPETNGGDTGSFTQVDFPTPFTQGTEVIVIPMIQTFNGADSPGLRIVDVNRKGFKVRMNEWVARGKPESDGNHTNEIIGYIAIAI
jgi:hypothetical protein